LEIFIPLLLGLCWLKSYILKTFINDLRIALSQIESSNELKKICRFAPLPCEFGAFSFWQEWDVHKIGGKLKRFPHLMCKN
jgi:hypothetical protein